MPTNTTNAQQDKYAPTHWGSDGAYVDLTVPSGQKCLVRRPGVEALLKAGILHKTDMLSKIVQAEHVNRVKPAPGKSKKSPTADFDDPLMELLKDDALVDDLIHTIDRIVCHVVVKPAVVMTPSDPTRRVDGVIYTDMIDLDDRIFIMNHAVGGQRDLKQFRSGSEEPVGSVGSESEASEETE